MDKPLITPAERSLDDLLSDLYGRLNYERQLRVSPRGFKLKNMRELLDRLGNPHLAYPVIHVAGTKGKGSVATMVGQILTDAGYRTGVYTSPHLETIHQRMVIDGQLISDHQLTAVLTTLEPIAAAMECGTLPAEHPATAPTFFEMTTAAAFQHFANQQVDAAVIEVGLGGRKDSTNVCQPSVCIITNISFDHTRQLGSTIRQIAFEKAGIIKPGVPVVCGAQHPDAIEVIEEVAADVGAPVFRRGRDFDFEECQHNASAIAIGDHAPPSKSFSITGRIHNESFTTPPLSLSLPGEHQRGNASLAVVASILLRQHGWIIPDSAIASGLQSTRLAGRAETMSVSPMVIVDIAHNPASAAALATTLASEIPAWPAASRRTLIFATSRDKDAAGILEHLIGQFDLIVITKYQSNPRASEPESLHQIARKAVEKHARGNSKNELHPTAINMIEHPEQAWRSVAENLTATDAVCVAGSAFLVAELRPIIQQWARSSFNRVPSGPRTCD